MQRSLTGSLSTAVVLLLLSSPSACDDAIEEACEVDTDCPAGAICRDARCGPVSDDGGTTAPTDAAPVCSSDGLACALPDECCARQCNAGRCGAPAPPPPAACRTIYELCLDDCCAGLTCTAGTCR